MALAIHPAILLNALKRAFMSSQQLDESNEADTTERKEWMAPEVLRMVAGDAELGDFSNADGGQFS